MSVPAAGVFQYVRPLGNRTHERGETIATGSGTYANNAPVGTIVRYDFPEPLVIDPTPGALYVLYVWNPSTVTALNVRTLNTVVFPVTGRHDVLTGAVFSAPASGGAVSPQLLAYVTNASIWGLSNGGGFSIYVTNATLLGAADTFTFEWILMRQ